MLNQLRFQTRETCLTLADDETRGDGRGVEGGGVDGGSVVRRLHGCWADGCEEFYVGFSHVDGVRLRGMVTTKHVPRSA